MRAIVATRFGGAEVLEVRDEPAPEAGAGQLVVDVEAIGVNFRDVYEREGRYGGTAPRIVGVEGAGTVASVGEGVRGISAGDRVAWADASGSYAEHVLVPAAKAVPVPDAVSTELAAASMLQGMTAQYLASATFPVQTGHDVLVHAAAGGVGLLLTQIVKARGGRVIATTSGAEKARLAQDAGADDVIDYERFGERARELTGGRGVSVVYDGVGQATFDESLDSLRTRGCMVIYGAASGPVAPVDVMRLLSGGSLYLTRPSLQHYTASPEELTELASDVFHAVADGRLHVRIGARYPLSEARRALEDLESRRTTGKLLLVPGG